MTQAELTSIKAAILSEPLNQQKGDAEIAAWLNSAGAKTVWKSLVTFDEVMNNGMDWTRVDNLSVGKARIWEWMSRLGGFNPSKPNIRAGIDATWVGTAPDLVVRAAVYAHCKRAATRAEGALATGTGTDADPATMTFEGEVSIQDVIDALTRG